MTKKKKNMKTRQFRKLEDLNLIDDFLFQQMLAQEKDGEEFVRILLSTILDKPIRNVKIISQKNILGSDTDKHGIRLDAYIQNISDTQSTSADVEIIPDIYDLEPNKRFEKDCLPKRMRYYHSLIDVQLLSSGTTYKNLPNVVIIIILPYDPFDKNRMVYTIQNQCIEEKALGYNDGSQKIFLYTKGTKGNPSQALKDMLQYIERTVEDNVTNHNIDTIHQLVTKVKRKKEVGISYMKSWERDDWMREEGYDDGFNDGFEILNQLNLRLAESGRTDDIIKAARDKEYCNQLLHEFGLQ